MTSLIPHHPGNALRLAPQAGELRHPDEAEGLDIESLFEAARRRYLVFLLVFVAVLALAVVLTLRQPKKYTASATVMMDPRQVQLFQRQSGTNGDLSLSTEAVATQVQLIQSRGLAERVVDTLHLDQDQRPTDDRPGAPTATSGVVLGLGVDVGPGPHPHRSVLGVLLEVFDRWGPPGTRLVAVSFRPCRRGRPVRGCRSGSA